MSEVFTVFYCWQSDANENHGRHLIREALDAAADNISQDPEVHFRVAVHSDTENEPGLCNIPETILRRLREADAIVSDLSFIAVNEYGGKQKHCSNPNVLFELGYAFKAIGPERLICVMNEVQGPSSNQVFDLAHHRRPISYKSPSSGKTRGQTVQDLTKKFEDALRGVLHYGLAGARGGEDEILHERQRSEIERYWHGPAPRLAYDARLTLSFRPKLFREKRWDDAQMIEVKVRDLSVHTSRFERYPPQPTGNAPMNWGLYNDTYGDPWTLTYAGQFWTKISIASSAPLKLSMRDAGVSPESPEERDIPAGSWISIMDVLPNICTVFEFVRSLATEFAGSELLQWRLEASGLQGKWLSFGANAQSMGPSKADTILREGEMSASDYEEQWLEKYVDFTKDFCDLFCRDGRVFTREELKEFRNPAGNI